MPTTAENVQADSHQPLSLSYVVATTEIVFEYLLFLSVKEPSGHDHNDGIAGDHKLTSVAL